MTLKLRSAQYASPEVGSLLAGFTTDELTWLFTSAGVNLRHQRKALKALTRKHGAPPRSRKKWVGVGEAVIAKIEAVAPGSSSRG